MRVCVSLSPERTSFCIKYAKSSRHTYSARLSSKPQHKMDVPVCKTRTICKMHLRFRFGFAVEFLGWCFIATTVILAKHFTLYYHDELWLPELCHIRIHVWMSFWHKIRIWMVVTAALKYFWNARKIVQNKYQNIRVKQKNPFFKKSADIIHLMGILHVIYYNCINILKTKWLKFCADGITHFLA